MKIRYTDLHIRRYLIAGALMLTPLWVTWIVLDFLFGLLSRMGRPWVQGFVNALDRIIPGISPALWDTWIESAVAAALTLFVIYAIGWATSQVLAKQVIAGIEAVLARIPLVHVIYGSTKKLLAALQTKPDRVQRVVMIDFPSAPMKAVGLVTRVVRDRTTGREMAIVYVPTSPNPTSGYMEIVPVDQLTPTDWTLDEAMRFVITGGTSAPDEVDFGRLPAAAGSAVR
jgi:uncharacterized membrane protein